MTTYQEFAIAYPMLMAVVLFIFGASVGSFLNVVIHRLPIMLEREWQQMSAEFLNITIEPCKEAFNLIVPRSRCPKCNHGIKAWQNMPIISYLLLKGQCYNCQAPITLRYPIIELITGLLTLAVYLKFGFSLQCLAAFCLVWALIALAMIDIDTQLLPDNLTIPLLWLGLICNSFELFVPLKNAVLSSAGAYLSLWLFLKAFKLITGKDGMGYGDFKLFAAFGAWFGWQALPFILIFASMAGALIGLLILYFKKQDRDTPLPFGPYLCAAGLLYLLIGQELVSWYLGLFMLG